MVPWKPFTFARPSTSSRSSRTWLGAGSGWMAEVVGRRVGPPLPGVTLARLGPHGALLWTHGDGRGVGNRGSHFQGARSTPRSVRLVRHAGTRPRALAASLQDGLEQRRAVEPVAADHRVRDGAREGREAHTRVAECSLPVSALHVRKRVRAERLSCERSTRRSLTIASSRARQPCQHDGWRAPDHRFSRSGRERMASPTDSPNR
jgi:hypothetical protein